MTPKEILLGFGVVDGGGEAGDDFLRFILAGILGHNGQDKWRVGEDNGGVGENTGFSANFVSDTEIIGQAGGNAVFKIGLSQAIKNFFLMLGGN